MRSNKAVIFSKNKKGRLLIDIPGMPGWDNFDDLAQFIDQVHHAKLLEQQDGPDARRGIFDHRGAKFELLHDDMMGNSLLSRSPEADEIVRQIAEDLAQRLET